MSRLPMLPGCSLSSLKAHRRALRASVSKTQVLLEACGALTSGGRSVHRTTRIRFLLLGLLVMAAPVWAQERAATTGSTESALETITVTGVRAAVEAAINVKEHADNIVEAISAEDIGKLPDTSIAESISRLPGVTAQRSDGRKSDISIRGTDPGFATGLLNGREQVSTGDNRNIEYDQYPAELISGVVIYKTPDASLIV